MPATSNVPAQQSQQVAAGFAKNFSAAKLDVSIEGYYKWMTNLIEYKEGASFISRSDWQTQVESGGLGRAYGLEFLVQKKVGRLSGWVGYTLAWSKRQFDNLYPLYDVTASGLTEEWYNVEPNRYRVGNAVRENHFGMISIDWSNQPPKISSSAWSCRYCVRRRDSAQHLKPSGQCEC